MANDLFFTTQRDGNWSRPMQYHDSPWWIDDASARENFTPGPVATITVRHNLTMDKDTDIGASYQAAIWEPLSVSSMTALSATFLATGHYTLGASVVSPTGETGLGNTVTAPILLTQGVSKPRVVFAKQPPAGCTYSLYLDDPDNPGNLALYCTQITDVLIDLISQYWGNTGDAGMAWGGTATRASSPSPIPPGRSNAVTITAEGSLIIPPARNLLARGDVVVQSPAGSTKPYMQIGAGATLRTDPTLAVDPTRAGYLVFFQGGGDIRFLG